MKQSSIEDAGLLKATPVKTLEVKLTELWNSAQVLEDVDHGRVSIQRRKLRQERGLPNVTLSGFQRHWDFRDLVEVGLPDLSIRIRARRILVVEMLVCNRVTVQTNGSHISVGFEILSTRPDSIEAIVDRVTLYDVSVLGLLVSDVFEPPVDRRPITDVFVSLVDVVVI